MGIHFAETLALCLFLIAYFFLPRLYTHKKNDTYICICVYVLCVYRSRPSRETTQRDQEEGAALWVGEDVNDVKEGGDGFGNLEFYLYNSFLTLFSYIYYFNQIN